MLSWKLCWSQLTLTLFLCFLHGNVRVETGVSLFPSCQYAFCRLPFGLARVITNKTQV